MKRTIILTLLMTFAFFSCKQTEKQKPPATSNQDAASTLAVLDGQIITEAEITTNINTDLDLHQQYTRIYEMKKDILDHYINEKIIQIHAKQENKESAVFLDEYLSKRVQISDDEINNFYETVKNNPGLQGTEAEKKERIREYLGERKKASIETALMDELRAKHKIEIKLAPPPYPTVKVSIENQPIWGNKDAPVTIVEFSDFECPYCKRMSEIVKRLGETYPDKVKIVFKDFPLTKVHKFARSAALAAGCADDQNKFWDYHNLLFKNNRALNKEDLLKYAEELQLDLKAFEECYTSEKHAANIDNDVAEGTKAGINATPTVIINEKLITGSKSFEGLKSIIDEELGITAQAAPPTATPNTPETKTE